MASPEAILHELVEASRELGREDRGLVILGEGNTSATCGDGTFWVKVSGSQLHDIDAAGFCRVAAENVTALLEAGRPSDQEVMDGLRQALVDPRHGQPSVETFLHAVCLEAGARWVAHTHPISVNSILCSRLGAAPFLRHIFPEAVVVCGQAPAVVPYVDPGLPLGRATREALRRYRQQHGQLPRIILLVNHGLVALGQTAREAVNITLMADKWAKILHGTYAWGGPRFLPRRDVARIAHRLDERFRQKRLAEK